MSKKALKTLPIALLEHVLIKNWLTNTTSLNTRSAQHVDLLNFIDFMKIKDIDDLKEIERSDIMEWRNSMLGKKSSPKFAIRSVKRRMSTVSKFFEYLCDQRFVEISPLLGVERPKLTSNEDATAAISEHQARDLLDAPDPATLIGKRDRAILATFL